MSATDTREAIVTEPKHRPYAAVVTGALLVVVGVLWLLDAVDVIDLEAKILLPSVLAVIGIALIVGAFDGPHTGLVVAGVLVTLASMAVAAAPTDAFHGGIGERNLRITEQADLAPGYDVGLGELSLDLGDLEMTRSAEVRVTVGAGEVRITLPPDIPVDIDASAGAGEIDLLGETEEGISVSRSYTSDGFDTADVTLTLEISVAAGSIEVNQ